MISDKTYVGLLADGMAAQGDLLVVRADMVNDVKDDWEVVFSEDGSFVVAHSETGHHHVLRGYRPPTGLVAGQSLKSPVLWRDPKAENPELRSIVEVPEGTLAEIVHLRDNHTHGTLRLPAGVWVLIRQQRPTPEGWEVVAD